MKGIGGMISPETIDDISFVFKQYVDTFPCKPQCSCFFAQVQAPFLLGYNLTMYVAEKMSN